MLILSWYAHGDLAEAALAMLESVRLPCRVCFLRQRAQRSQYGHLREALAAFSELRLAPAECSWLMFSDDDDLWHPRRAHLTRLACTRTSAAPIDARSAKSTRAIGFGVYAYPVDTEQPEHRARDGGTLEERLQTATAVDSALERRTAGVWLGASEVFQYAVRPSLLFAFFRSHEESIVCHRFADVRFASWMRQEHGASVVELDAAQLMELDAQDGSAPRHPQAKLTPTQQPPPSRRPPSHPRAERWVISNWFYFYRNQRRQSEVSWMDNLQDLSAHHATSSGGSPSDGGEYERASTGRQVEGGDVAAARRLLRSIPVSVPWSAGARKQEEEALAVEIGRRRHHAELSAMMCFGYRNAAELALTICTQMDAQGQAAGAVIGSATAALDAALQDEQTRLVREALEAFCHAKRQTSLPIGSIQDVLG